MSPPPEFRRRARGGFPRVSGDEPFFVSARTDTITFSPRERG